MKRRDSTVTEDHTPIPVGNNHSPKGGDAIRRTRQLKDQEGIFAGPSCGAALHAALRVASSMERGKIVVILADGGWKYLSEDLWTRDLDELEDELEAKVLW